MDRQDVNVTTVIGADTIITGTIRAQGTILIDGRVDGDICTDDVLMIGETVVVVGNIYASSVICRGMIVGDIVASEEVKLLDSASLNGTVRTPVFLVDDGALLTDNVEAAYETEELSDDEDVLPIRAVA